MTGLTFPPGKTHDAGDELLHVADRGDRQAEQCGRLISKLQAMAKIGMEAFAGCFNGPSGAYVLKDGKCVVYFRTAAAPPWHGAVELEVLLVGEIGNDGSLAELAAEARRRLT